MTSLTSRKSGSPYLNGTVHATNGLNLLNETLPRAVYYLKQRRSLSHFFTRFFFSYFVSFVYFFFVSSVVVLSFNRPRWKFVILIGYDFIVFVKNSQLKLYRFHYIHHALFLSFLFTVLIFYINYFM